jgi:hypothetical protein
MSGALRGRRVCSSPSSGVEGGAEVQALTSSQLMNSRRRCEAELGPGTPTGPHNYGALMATGPHSHRPSGSSQGLR